MSPKSYESHAAAAIGYAFQLPKRIGYRSFIGLIWMFFKMNRKAKKLQYKSNYEVTLPIKWL